METKTGYTLLYKGQKQNFLTYTYIEKSCWSKTGLKSTEGLLDSQIVELFQIIMIIIFSNASKVNLPTLNS